MDNWDPGRAIALQLNGDRAKSCSSRVNHRETWGNLLSHRHCHRYWAPHKSMTLSEQSGIHTTESNSTQLQGNINCHINDSLRNNTQQSLLIDFTIMNQWGSCSLWCLPPSYHLNIHQHDRSKTQLEDNCFNSLVADHNFPLERIML